MNFVEGAEAERHGAKTIGIRPEHVKISTESGDWKGKVGVAEHLGSDTFLHVHTDHGTINVRAGGELAVDHGDTVYLTPMSTKLHKFGADGSTM
jgi:multiple sugar transport system ATP-binding protein